MTKVFIARVQDHPEYEELIAGAADLINFTKLFISVRNVPDKLIGNIVITDWEANEFVVVPNE